MCVLTPFLVVLPPESMYQGLPVGRLTYFIYLISNIPGLLEIDKTTRNYKFNNVSPIDMILGLLKAKLLELNNHMSKSYVNSIQVA